MKVINLKVQDKKRYQKLEVWQKAYKLILSVYDFSNNFPRHEDYSLKLQMRSCAISIPSNIAEGYMRQYLNEYIQFLSIALGSAGELETQLMIARDVNLLGHREYIQLEKSIGIVIAMLIRPIKTLKVKKNNQP